MNTATHNIDEAQFNKAIKLRDKGEIDEAIAILESLLEHSERASTLGILGSLYAEKEDYEKANHYYRRTTRLGPGSELASVGLFLSYMELDRHAEAIKELKRYLDKYPPKIYKTTLVELLEDLKGGYATDYEDTIQELATKYKISLDEK